MSVREDLLREAIQKTLAKRRGEDVPTEDAAVSGWRAWRAPRRLEFGAVPFLRSVTYSEYAWAPRERARADCSHCQSRDPEARECTPGDGCGCGFYAAKTLAHLRTMGYHTYHDESDGDVTVVGKVACWGKVIEGTQGWRAEYAYPVVLYVPFEAYRIAAPLEETYGVTTKLLNLLDPTAKPGMARNLVVPSGSTKVEPPKYLAQYRKRKHDKANENDEEE